jgi:WD40 repeat protein/tRNA A-37 threonylcarbamoyl transferase component Bud32
MDLSDKAERERRLDEVATAYLKEIEAGRAPVQAEWLARYPELAGELADFFAAQDQVDRLAAPLRVPAAPAPGDLSTAGPTPPPEAAAASPLGTVRYFGEYELLEEIARGGMGVVYRARQAKLKRVVAVKMILAGALANPSDVERFYTEARAAAHLHHPNIVPIHEVGEHDGQHYFSMDYVAGDSLAHRIARGPLPAREAAALLKTVTQAVSFAHVEGVIHRDLKPANILLDKQGTPHVTDFGLAKRVESEPEAAAGLTETGQVLGTPSYMPPEQAAGRTKEIGPCADVYALGAVLYCALTGRPPFQAASTLDTLMQVLDREPVPPRTLNASVPRDLETICLKCLEKDPWRRYGSAQELADELARYLDGRPILARPIGAAGRTRRWCRRNPVVAGLSAALVLALVAGMAASSTFAVQAHEFGEQAHREAVASDGLRIKADELTAQATRDADRATEQERLTRRYLYTAHMNLAHEALKSGNLLRAGELLELHQPIPDHEDLRSFDWRYLWRQCNRQQKTIPLTEGVKSTGYLNRYRGVWVEEFSVSPNGQFVAVSFKAFALANQVRLVDVKTGTVRKSIVAEPNPKFTNMWRQGFSQLVFSSDSKGFAMVTWDLPDEGSIIPHNARLTIWDLDTMTERQVIPLPNFQHTYDRIAISPRTAAAGYCEGDKLFSTIKVWDLPEDVKGSVGPERILPQREQARPEMPGKHDFDASFSCFTFTPDGQALAWAERRLPGLIFTSVSGDGKQRSLPMPSLYSDLYNYLAVSPDGCYVAYAPPGPVVKLLDAHSGAEVHAFPAGSMQRSDNDLSQNHGQICFSPDSRILAFGRGLSVSLWDVSSKKQLGEVRWPVAPVRALGFGQDSRTLVSVADNNEAKVWDVNSRPGTEDLVIGPGPKRERELQPAGVENDRIAGLGIAPDGKTLAVVYTSRGSTIHEVRTVRLYDLPASLGNHFAELHWDTPKEFLPTTATFSDDGKWLAISGDGRHDGLGHPVHVQLWRISRGPKTEVKLERTFFAPQCDSQRSSSAVAFSPDGTKFAYPAGRLKLDKDFLFRYPDCVQVYDLAAGTTKQFPADTKSRFVGAPYWLLQWDTHEGNCGGVVFSSDGKRLFSIHHWSSGCWIMAWDIATGAMLSVLYSQIDAGEAARTLALSPDGRTLASCHRDTIQLWDVSDPALQDAMAKVKEQDDDVRTGKSKTASVVATPRAILRGHSDIIAAMAFHPDGKTLASASNDGTVKLWDVATGEIRLTLEGRVTGLTINSNGYTRVAALAFTPDGDTLMYGTDSGTLREWHAASRLAPAAGK